MHAASNTITLSKYGLYILVACNCVDKVFTAKEVALFKTRLEEGYDITSDERYNEWLKRQGRKPSI